MVPPHRYGRSTTDVQDEAPDAASAHPATANAARPNWPIRCRPNLGSKHPVVGSKNAPESSLDPRSAATESTSPAGPMHQRRHHQVHPIRQMSRCQCSSTERVECAAPLHRSTHPHARTLAAAPVGCHQFGPSQGGTPGGHLEPATQPASH